VSIIIRVVGNIINLGMFPYYYRNIYCPCWFGLLLCLLFLLAYVLFTSILFLFFFKNLLKRSSSSEAKEQAQGLLPIDLKLITNIVNNPMKMCLFHLSMCEKKNKGN